MNKYESIKADMTTALKNGDKLRRLTLANMVTTIDKAATSGKKRVEITDIFVDEVLIKYQKTIQEMIDTCPADRTELLAKYLIEMKVVKEYAPQLLTDKKEIRKAIAEILSATNTEILVQNKGKIMKCIMPYFKGKADMKIVNQVVGEMIT